jgi:hypothetical protein
MGGTATVRTGIDAYVDSSLPNTNYKMSTQSRVHTSSPVDYSFIWFKNPAPSNSTIVSATMRLYNNNGNLTGTIPVTAQRVAAYWAGTQITYNNMPGVTGATTTVSKTNPVANTEWAFDVTSQLQSITDGAANYGFRLATSSSVLTSFASFNAAVSSIRPTLEVVWSPAPNVVPGTLSPSGGRAVSIAKPVLRFDFTDLSGSTSMQALQVQISTSTSFTSPEFDSGTVASSDPQFDTAASAWAGISVAATRYWRARVQDTDSLWSPWSDAGQFTRAAQGTLTLTNPAVSPNNFVTETTPPITWTLTGVTQESWRLTVALDSDPTRYLYDTGRITSTATARTIPSGIIKSQTAVYRVVISTWDTVDRASTPGDPAGLSVSRAFTFNEDATTAPVTGLSAAQVTSRPLVVVSWSRSTAPDSFTVVRDGQTVEANIAPGDVFTTGTSYAYTDRGASASTSHTWKVQAVVNGKASASNPTATLTYTLKAVWITGVLNILTVPVLVTDSAQFDMPETAAVYEPVGASAVVRVAQSQRGLQGSISGRVIDYAGTAAATWVANLQTFKSQPDKEVRLLIGAQNLRCLIGNIVIAPLAGGNADDRAVSFDFWSLDGPQ